MEQDPEQGTVRNADLAALRHNLRTSVNQILRYSEMLIEEASDAANTRGLAVLRHVHSAAVAMLSEVNDCLANRDEVSQVEIDALCNKIHPRVERIAGSVNTLLQDPENVTPADWSPDLQQIDAAARSVMEQFSVNAAPGVTVPERPRVERSRTASTRILVVHGDAVARKSISRRLERQGFGVEEAASGNDALDRVATESFDLILLDLLMPVMDGFEVLARLKNERRMSGIPVLAAAPAGQPDAAVRAMELGADDYVYKPLDPVLVRHRMGAVLSRRRMADDLAAQRKAQSIGVNAPAFARAAQDSLKSVRMLVETGDRLLDTERRQLERPAAEIDEASLSELRDLIAQLKQTLATVREHTREAERVAAILLEGDGEAAAETA